MRLLDAAFAGPLPYRGASRGVTHVEITLGTPLANGASLNLQFLLGIQQTGSFRLYLNIEALP